ncbi:uncharacterized protein J8A68_001339 [[Candida] subhashii]|uniref:AB hydrolase-1 domain-containing protein n=1 Tax=[Candida] subhashii TaxID=561895 RepID=A0A8J5UK99_9ASCO|nr:uncharacterized protein J8A68_001339 [[Candida] subhashii]KAG7665283.1 hypothetical protein J8A68_001339 [[Candida] subhashii]
MPLTPATSSYYQYTLKVEDAANPRAPGSVVLKEPSSLVEDYQLKVAYRKYVTTKTIPHRAKRINFLFLHGNGMNKGLWHYHIDQLYTMYSLIPDMYIDTVIAADHANMGDSAYANRDKLGQVCDWNDLVKDYIMITKIHEREAFLHPDAFNVIVGHSMGGFLTIQLTANEPNLFQCSVLVNPVCANTPEANDSFIALQRNWYDRGFVKYNFDIPPGKNWYDEVYDHFTTKSFYKMFDPVVLKNMVEDEIPEGYQRDKYYETVLLKHDGNNDYISYYNQYFSIPVTYSCKLVHSQGWFQNSPSFLERSDTIKQIVDERLHSAQLQVLHGHAHNMHAQSPNVILSYINEFVVETYKNNQKPNDYDYLKQFGPDYKKILFENRMKEFLGDRKIHSKL